MISPWEYLVAFILLLSALAIGAVSTLTFLVWVAGWDRLRCDRRADPIRSPLREG